MVKVVIVKLRYLIKKLLLTFIKIRALFNEKVVALTVYN